MRRSTTGATPDDRGREGWVRGRSERPARAVTSAHWRVDGQTRRGRRRRTAQSRCLTPCRATGELAVASCPGRQARQGVTVRERSHAMVRHGTLRWRRHRGGRTGHHGDVAAQIRPTATAREPVAGEGHRGPLMTAHEAEQSLHRANPPPPTVPGAMTDGKHCPPRISPKRTVSQGESLSVPVSACRDSSPVINRTRSIGLSYAQGRADGYVQLQNRTAEGSTRAANDSQPHDPALRDRLGCPRPAPPRSLVRVPVPLSTPDDDPP